MAHLTAAEGGKAAEHLLQVPWGHNNQVATVNPGKSRICVVAMTTSYQGTRALAWEVRN